MYSIQRVRYSPATNELLATDAYPGIAFHQLLSADASRLLPACHYGVCCRLRPTIRYCLLPACHYVLYCLLIPTACWIPATTVRLGWLLPVCHPLLPAGACCVPPKLLLAADAYCLLAAWHCCILSCQCLRSVYTGESGGSDSAPSPSSGLTADSASESTPGVVAGKP